MGKNDPPFVIDDKLGTSDNLDAYAALLEAMDPSLGTALRPHLASLATGQPINTAAIWDCLYTVTASATIDPTEGAE